MALKIFSNIKSFILKHKIISLIIIVALAGGGYYWYSSSTSTIGVTKYVLASAKKTTINTSVSGTGQVSASNQVALSFRASGKVVYLNATSGQKVSSGTLLAQLDTTDQQKTIRDAQSSLDAEQITLQKLQGSTDSSTPRNKQDAIDALNQAYESGYNTVSNVFIDLPSIMTDLQNILYENTLNNTQQNIDFYANSANSFDQNALKFKDSLTKSYKIALDSYNKNFTDYKTTSRFSDNTTIDSTINETYETTKNIAQALKDTNNLIQFYKDTLAQHNTKPNPTADTQLATLNTDSSKANSDIINLLNAQSTIKNDKDAVSNSDLDLQSEQLNLKNRQNALADAKSNLSNYYIYAPFDGVIGSTSIKKGDSVSSGSSAITFITTKDITQISLNEVDITKIKIGNKATLTFDAISGLSITGQVTEIDTIGTVSQGVVSYNATITFDTQDARIKPGMSVNASIITETKQNVLTVPNSAVKTKNGKSYVLVMHASANTPTQKAVEVGISDSTNTEITSGLNEGDRVVSRTITATASTTATTSTSRTTTNATRNLIPGGTTGGGFRPGN